MFVRWNDTAKIWEYDSAGGSGAGPWVQLPNVPYKDQSNVFTKSQHIEGNVPEIMFVDTAQPVDQRIFRAFNQSQYFYIQSTNDAVTVSNGVNYIDRSGNLFSKSYSEHGRSVPMGYKVDIPYVNMQFSTYPAGTWTVSEANIAVNAFTIIGNTMIYNLIIKNSTVTAGVSHLALAAGASGIGGGTYKFGAGRCDATLEAVTCYSVPGDPYIYINRPGGLAWPASTASIYITMIWFV